MHAEIKSSPHSRGERLIQICLALSLGAKDMNERQNQTSEAHLIEERPLEKS